jgi:hypothetical protein
MNARDILDRAKSLGLKLEAKGDQIAVQPGSKCPPEFKELLRKHKVEVLPFLKGLPCAGWKAVPPEELRLNPIPPTPTDSDFGLMLDFVRRQTGAPDDPLLSWYARRNQAYQTAYKWPSRLVVYAAARDLVCFQLARTELDACDLLRGFEGCRRHVKPDPYAAAAKVKRLPTWRGKVTLLITEKAALCVQLGCRSDGFISSDSEEDQRQPNHHL